MSVLEIQGHLSDNKEHSCHCIALNCNHTLSTKTSWLQKHRKHCMKETCSWFFLHIEEIKSNHQALSAHFFNSNIPQPKLNLMKQTET